MSEELSPHKKTPSEQATLIVENVWVKGVARAAMVASFYMLADVYTDWKEFRKNTINELVSIKLDILQLKNQDLMFNERQTNDTRSANERITQVSSQVADVRMVVERLRDRIFNTIPPVIVPPVQVMPPTAPPAKR